MVSCIQINRMTNRLAVVGLGVSCLLFASSHIEHLDFPAGGVLRLPNSIGELTVEGWDRPDVEIITIQASDKVRVVAERRGDEIVVTTSDPRHHGFLLHGAEPSELAYNIKVPRNAKLMVHHEGGEVHVDNITGDIHATNRQGAITLHLTWKGPAEIDAKSHLGSVTSDFPGGVKRRWLVGHYLMQPNASAQKLYLRIGYGDIIIQRAQTPVMPAPAAP
jgi:hypothetical protein